MKILKHNFTSNEQNSNEHIEDLLTFSGFDKNAKVVRIRYVHVSEIIKKKSPTLTSRELTLNKIRIPEGFSMADALKTISYVVNQVSKKLNENKNGLICCQLTHDCLSQYHFTPVEENKKKKENFVDIYFVDGIVSVFPNSKYYDDYFDWYQNSVTRDEIQQIYKNAGLNMPRTTKCNFEKDIETEPGQ